MYRLMNQHLLWYPETPVPVLKGQLRDTVWRRVGGLGEVHALVEVAL